MKITPVTNLRTRSRTYHPATYRHNISWQVKTTVDDGQGGETPTWTHSFYRKMSRTPLKGFLRYQAQQIEEKITHIFKGHYKSGLNAADYRLKDGDSNYYMIRAILVDDRKQEMTIEAEEVRGVAP